MIDESRWTGLCSCHSDGAFVCLLVCVSAGRWVIALTQQSKYERRISPRRQLMIRLPRLNQKADVVLSSRGNDSASCVSPQESLWMGI